MTNMDMAKHFAKTFFANRIGGENFGKADKIYKFEKIKRAKRSAMHANPDRVILDMGVGEPDNLSDELAINTLSRESKLFENRGYADNGCVELKGAISQYMKKMFKVSLDPETEILHSIGSKAALSILPLCFVDRGDSVVATIPGYPIFATHARYLGAYVINMPLLQKNNYLPQLDSLSDDVWASVKVVSLNYPNNPTGAICTRDFFEEIVALAHRHSFLIINDAAYSPLTFANEDRLSILEIDGAKEVALELHSMSKGFNMSGWRMGWVCGNKYLVDAYGSVKNNTDSGQFIPIQKAAAKTLENLSTARDNANRYSKRMDAVIKILNGSGFNAIKPRAGFFLYTKIPLKVEKDARIFSFENAEQFSEWLIAELGIVTVPWDDVEQAIRLSMTFTSSSINEQQAIAILKERVSSLRFYF